MLTFASRFGEKSNILMKITTGKALNYANSMPNINNKNFIYASSYGSNGLKGLHNLGLAKFMNRTRVATNFTKTGYKGNFDALLNALNRLIPSSLLYSITLLGLFYFTRKFFVLSKRIL